MRLRIAVVALVVATTCMGAIAVAAPGARKAAAPSLEARPRAAAPGNSVVLFGNGFAPNVRIALLAGPPNSEATRIGRALTDAEGRFRAPIRIAARVEPGRYVALACRHRCAVKASAPFRVLTP